MRLNLFQVRFEVLRHALVKPEPARDFHGVDLLKGDPDSSADPLELSFDVRGTGEGGRIRIAIERSDVAALSEEDRRRVADVGANYVARVRKERSPSMMEAFLAEYACF